MKKHMSLCLAVVVVASIAVTAAPPSTDHELSLIYVSQNESDMERAISKYISEVHDIQAEIVELPDLPGDLVLKYGLDPDGAPELTAVVDSGISAQDKEKDLVEERYIRVRAYYVLPDSAKTPAMRAKILELNNTFHNEKIAPGRIYIDEDGDLALQTLVNVPGLEVPLHAEVILDALVRMNMAWGEYYPGLKKILPSS